MGYAAELAGLYQMSLAMLGGPWPMVQGEEFQT